MRNALVKMGVEMTIEDICLLILLAIDDGDFETVEHLKCELFKELQGARYLH